MKEKIKYISHLVSLEIERQDQVKRENIEKLREIQRHIRTVCDHSETTFYPDASGNNDSCYVCDICGLEKKRFK